jgi:hypothetical protein
MTDSLQPKNDVHSNDNPKQVVHPWRTLASGISCDVHLDQGGEIQFWLYLWVVFMTSWWYSV